MNTKILRHRNLFGCLFAIFLSLPMLNVLSRVLYTQWNKEAYQSYSDKLLEETEQITSYSEIIPNKIYEFVYEDKQSSQTSPIFRFSEISFDLYEWNPRLPQQNYDGFLVYGLNNNGYLYYGDSRVSFDPKTLNFNFTFKAKATPNANPFTNFNIYTYVYNENTLDNAFEYSINKITDNNLGNIQFFTWFVDMFVDLSQPQNALYVNFINWYFNYALLVSVVYILFLVLMWFINFIRKLLEKGMDFGQRGY